jgi:hypothetical protein
LITLIDFIIDIDIAIIFIIDYTLIIDIAIIDTPYFATLLYIIIFAAIDDIIDIIDY